MAEDSEETGRTRQNLALYRKYRPATFAEVRGQEHVTQPLRQALSSGRINHAYLFSGPRGCGKTSSARILARSLNCVNGPTPDPCGVCDSCVALAPSGPGSIDVIEIDAASHGGVDDARDLRERAFYAPVAGRFKIYIIDEAHMVTQQGFNALLKLVEEPPPHLKFIFATTEPEKVIATIRSRTHHYPFRLMPPSVMRELTEEILNAEGVKFDPAVLPLVVRAGAGSARDTLSILDQLLAGSDDSGIRYDRAVALLGYTDATLLDEIVDAFAAGDGAAVFRAVNRVIEGGHEPRRFATDMLDRFRDLIVLASVPDAITTGLLDVPPDRVEALTAQASRSGLAALTRAAEIISAGLDQMRGATSPRLLLELMCAQVLLPAAATDERSLLARLERLESGAVNQSYPERTRPAPEPSVTPEPSRPVEDPAAAAPPAPGAQAPADPAQPPADPSRS
ncbi:MAG: DNA polymerase III subunit gamma and tau, partial [Trebonia sp.]|uniref:DNA polymerase III subunit gamma and tau n=1 Tax=Trebonia sp. TaxID=2767075 RepID=UPI003C77E1F5